MSTKPDQVHCNTVSNPLAVIANNPIQWINPTGGARLAQVIGLAAAYGLVVDLTWTIEGAGPNGSGVFSPMSKTAYKAALGAVTNAMKGQFPNAFFDIENEYNLSVCVGQANNPKPAFTAADLQEIVSHLRAIDNTRPPGTAARLFTASITIPPSSQCPPGSSFFTKNAGGRYTAQLDAVSAGFDIVSYHDPRNWYLDSLSYPYPSVACDTANLGHQPDWAWLTDDEAADMVQTQQAYGIQKPIYYSEPDRYLPGPSAQNYPNAVLTSGEFVGALQGAIAGGAAAWTFHTEGTFKLDGAGVTLHPPETQFLSTFRGVIGWPQ